jgi:hypothetical protein
MIITSHTLWLSLVVNVWKKLKLVKKHPLHKTPYKMPEELGTDPAANMALFLVENVGSIYDRWDGRMSAVDQRKLFGRFLGKGVLGVYGKTEMLTMTRKVCFGTDWDTTWYRWAEFKQCVS